MVIHHYSLIILYSCSCKTIVFKLNPYFQILKICVCIVICVSEMITCRGGPPTGLPRRSPVSRVAGRRRSSPSLLPAPPPVFLKAWSLCLSVLGIFFASSGLSIFAHICPTQMSFYLIFLNSHNPRLGRVQKSHLIQFTDSHYSVHRVCENLTMV